MAFNYKEYEKSDAVKKKEELLQQNSTYNQAQSVKDAYTAWQNNQANKVGDWAGGTYGVDLKKTLEKINNREKFSYDLNGDMLYQQYKDQYMNQGKLAMADTIGQASAMTGGYGNSYATTVGNQAYQSYLGQLNNVIPELYQMALNQYNQQGQELKDQYSMLNQQYESEYGRYRDKVADWYNEDQRLSDRYYNESNLDYNRFATERDYLANDYNNERNYDYGQYSDAYNRAFSTYQQQVSEDQYAKDLAIKQAQVAQSAASNNLAREKFEYEKEVAANAINYAELKEMSAAEIADQLDYYNTEENWTAMGNFLDALTASGVYTQAQADAIFDDYKKGSKQSTSEDPLSKASIGFIPFEDRVKLK